MSGHEISRLQHALQLIMARYTRIINCRPCCNLYVSSGQRNARPTVTFPARELHRSLASNELYCKGMEKLPRVATQSGFEPSAPLYAIPCRHKTYCRLRIHIQVLDASMSPLDSSQEVICVISDRQRRMNNTGVD